MNIIWLQISSLIYAVLLLIAYFIKKRFPSKENNIFKYLIIMNIIGLIIELSCFYTVINIESIPFFNYIVTRLLIIYYVAFMMIYTIYVFIVSYNVNNNENKNIMEKVKKFCLIYFILFSIVLWILPMYYHNFNNQIYSYGPSINLLSLSLVGLLILWIVVLIKNFKNVKTKNYIPIIAFIFLAGIGGIIQKQYPYLTITTVIETFILYLMYFTIENPDLQMLREMHNAKEYNDNLNIEKSRFLFNMAKEVRVPLQNINRLSKQSLMEDDITLVKQGLNKIKYSSNNLLELVNKVLDINDLEKRKISTRQSKYNIELLFKKIISVVKPKIENKGIEFRINYDKSIPTNLYGDSIRIKQVVTTILNHSVDLTKEGFIELSVNSIIKHDNCRIVIKIEDSSSGMKQDEIEKVFEVNIEKDIENIDDKDISIGLVKKILDLIGGTIIVNSEIGKGTSYTIVVDQQIVDSKKNTIEQAVEKYEELYIKNKRILLVINNEDLNKKLTKLLNKYEVEVVRVTGGQACLERIRKNEKYDLIIMEDELDKLSSIDTLNKLKQIENFKIPVIILTRKIEMNIKKEYSKLGFTDTYIIPVSKESVKEIINNYISKED